MAGGINKGYIVNKKTFLLVLILTQNIYANTFSGLTQEQEQELISEGLPLPGSGVTLVPRNEIILTPIEKKKVDLLHESKLKYGYLNEYNDRAKELLNLKETVSYKNKNKNIPDLYNTGMKKNISDLPMSYSFSSVPENQIKEIIGFAPMGTFLQDQGWTGAGEFFEPKFGGTCAFSESNLILTRGSAILPKEDVTYTINGKVTLNNVIGNNNSGYLYEVEWFDKNFRRKLECATKEYSQKINQSVISLSQEIDKNEN